MKPPTKLEIDMARLETEMKNVTEEVKELKEDVKSLATKEDVTSLKSSLESFIERADNEYAGKWVESVWRFVFAVVGTAVLGALLSLIIIKK